MIEPSELPMECGAMPALAAVARPMVNAALRINDRTIVSPSLVEPPSTPDLTMWR
jgi:hypothetical protein